ncbi:hypothetical protein HGRIS_007224 [Hohenbuehelia grisea]|uniref:Uncharacterized protein n=1 Tax=Hohenbuehelia grisea TaxID=104357 RepID=A0ABR3JCL9_9AGAR
MLFSRALSFFTVALSFGAVSQAAPAGSTDAIVKRASSADIAATLATLSSDLASPLASITSAGSSGTATLATVQPLINEVTAALGTASDSLASLNARRSLSLSKRQSDDDIANTIAGIVTDITNALDGVATVPGVAALLPGVDLALNQVLRGLETLLAGVLNLVATLLVDVAALLRSLAFGLTLASLGL